MSGFGGLVGALLLLVSFRPDPSLSQSASEKLTARVSGDIVLGGLFPMHEYNISRRDMPCGAIKEEKGIQVRVVLLTQRAISQLVERQQQSQI